MSTAENNFNIKGTYGTIYYVKDVIKSIQFLKDKLGIEPAYEHPEWTEFSINGHSLCLHPSDDTVESDKTALILHVDNIQNVVNSLKAKGIGNVSGPHEIQPGAYHAQFTDLDGNIISFYEGPKHF